jgi:hypothetical protein
MARPWAGITEDRQSSGAGNQAAHSTGAEGIIVSRRMRGTEEAGILRSSFIMKFFRR